MKIIMDIYTMTEKRIALLSNNCADLGTHWKHSIIGIVICLLINDFTYAQSFSSIRMERLGSEIPAACLPSTDSIFDCPELLKNKSLVVNYDEKHDITHLGISLFSNETKELLNLPVCNFIERMMLELVLEQSDENLLQKMDRLKLKLLKNGSTFGEFGFTSLSKTLDEIQHPAQFNLMKEKDQFAAVWKYNQDDQFVFAFPVSRYLIFGTDKKESDELLNKVLFGNSQFCNDNRSLPGERMTEAELTYDQGKNIFTKKGGEFMMPVINSNTYYEKTAETFTLLFSKDFPEESFLNLIMKNMGGLNHKLHVTHRMYGNFSPDFDVSLKEFLCYFQDDFNFFTAVTSPDSKQLKLTAILRNKEYNYIHLLLISTPVENIFRQNGLLTAEFYSNIPQQSIRSLIGDVTNKK